MSSAGSYVSHPDIENPTVVFADLKDGGYEDIVGELVNHGFFPKKNYIFWETPFADYSYKNYNFTKGLEASLLNNRTFHFDGGNTLLPDMSYVVEPVKGLWLLALDANVYIPQQGTSHFSGAGIGYNEVLKHKKYLINWTQK